MLERKTIVDVMEIRRDDSLSVRLALLVVDGEKEVTSQYYRVTFEPGQNALRLMEEVNQALRDSGEAEVSSRDIQRIVEHMA